MRTVWMPGGLRVEIHLTAADTGGACCLIVDHPPVGWSLPAHRHARETEVIHVVAGEFAVTVDGERRITGPGDTITIPPGTEHGAELLGEEPGRRVVIFSPGGMEEFFAAAGTEQPGEQYDLRQLLELAARYGWRFTGA